MQALMFCLVLLATACGVPTPPTLSELEEKAQQGDERAVDGLVALLGRQTPGETRAQAYRVLVKLDGVGEDRILRACRDPDPVRREHALALATNQKIPGIHDESVRALEDSSFSRRYVAAWALGEIGDPRGVGPLVAALEGDGGEVAREAARSLVKLGRSSTPPLLDALPRLRGDARGYVLRVLGELRDPRASEALLGALADPESRADAAWSLGKLGDPNAAEALEPHVADPDWRVRLEVVRALGLLEARGSEAGVETLRITDPVTAVREWAARTLAVFRGRPQTYPNARGEWVEPENLYR